MKESSVPLDVEAFWMPFTANRGFKRQPRIITKASGMYFEDRQGRRIFDGLSGLWCSGLGHCRPEIADAIAAQSRTLDYAPAFQFGHPKAFELATRLRAMTPADLDYVFFTIKDVAAELRLDWHTVKCLEKQYMAEQLKRAGTPRPDIIAPSSSKCSG